MNLEDEVSDVVGKAMRGLGKEPGDIATEAGILREDLEEILNGKIEAGVLGKIAPLLELDDEALVGLPDYMPEQPNVPWVRRIELPFRDWSVNAWLLESGQTRLLFDTGWNRDDIAREVDVPSLEAVLITHPDVDHVGGIEPLEAAGVRIVSETEALTEGEFEIGGVKIRAVDLAGHREPAAGYFVEGFSRPMFVAGDAIFAGSMGGCKTTASYRRAFETLRDALAKAPPETLILPGHGPMTSLREEKVANPFREHF